MPSYLQPAILTALVVLSAGAIAVIALSERLSPANRRIGLAVFGLYLGGWLPFVAWVTAGGGFMAGAASSPVLPLLPLAAAAPVLSFGLALWISPAVRAWADGIDQRLLVALQSLRVMGWVFVALWLGSHIPWQFGLPAGVGDVAVGLLAGYALLRLTVSGEALAHWAPRVDAAGVLDFVVAVGTGVLTIPGALHLLAVETPNLMLTDWPLALIPAFAVPLFSVAHILSIRLSLKRSAQAAAALPV